MISIKLFTDLSVQSELAHPFNSRMPLLETLDLFRSSQRYLKISKPLSMNR